MGATDLLGSTIGQASSPLGPDAAVRPTDSGLVCRVGDGAPGEATTTDPDAAPSAPAATTVGAPAPRVAARRAEREPAELPVPIPPVDRDPPYLANRPLAAITALPAYLGPDRLPQIVAKQAKSLPPVLMSYREDFADAVARARVVVDEIVADAQMLGTALRRDEALRADRRDAALKRDMGRHETSLDAAIRELERWREDNLSALDSTVKETIRAIGGAEASGKARMHARAMSFGRELQPQHDEALAIEMLIADAMTRLAAAVIDAKQGLDTLQANAASSFTQAIGDDPPLMAAAVNETIIARIEPAVIRGKARTDREAGSLQTKLAAQATNLQPQLVKAFCQFTNWETLLNTEAPAELTRAAGTAIAQARRTGRRSAAQIRTGHERALAQLITQHNAARRNTIANAKARADAEQQQAAALEKGRHSASKAMAAAPGSAVKSIVRALELAPPPNEEALARGVQTMAGGIVSTALPNTRKQRIGARSGQERSFRQLHIGFLEGDLRASTTVEAAGRSLWNAAQISGRATQTMLAEVADGLRQMPGPVVQRTDGFLSIVDSNFEAARTNVSSSLSSTRTSVETSLNGAPSGLPPAAANEGMGTPPPQPCEGACCDAASPNSSNPLDLGGNDGPNMSMAPDPDAPNMVIERFKNYKTDAKTHPEIAAHIEAARVATKSSTTDPKGVIPRVSAIRGAFGYLDSDPNKILPNLRGLTVPRAQAMKENYDPSNLGKLEADCVSWLNKGNALSGATGRIENRRAARNYLAGNAAAGALHELNAAVEWSNENERIEAVMHSLTPVQMQELSQMDGLDNIRTGYGGLDGIELEVFDALLSVRPDDRSGLARAAALRAGQRVDEARDQHGEAGGDATRDRLTAIYNVPATSLLAGAEVLGMEDREVVDRRRAESFAAMQTTFANTHAGQSLFDYAAADRQYEIDVPNDYDDGTHKETVTDHLRDGQRFALQQLLLHGPESLEARAAAVANEFARPGGADPARLRVAATGLQINPGITPPGTQAYADAVRDRDRLFALIHEYAPADPSHSLVGPVSTDAIAENVAARLGATVRDEKDASYVRSLIVARPNDPDAMVRQLDYAMDGAGTNVDALRHTLGSMTREQFEATRTRYDELHPGGPDLLTRIGIRGRSNWIDSETSGDTAQEMERLSIGIPRTDRERAELAALEMRQQIRDAGGLGQWLAADEFHRLEGEHRNLMSMIGADHLDFDRAGNLVALAADGSRVTVTNFDADGNYIAAPGRSASDLAVAIAVGPLAARNYVAATDRIANAITTALVVATAVITTFFTGGLAASIWIPVLVTAGVGLFSIGLNMWIKGGRYGHEEILHDLAMTFVQAVTAGAGAAIGLYARGGALAVRAVASRAAVSEALLERFLLSKGVQMAEMTFARQVVVGAATGAIGGFGNAALDTEAWRKGTWGVGLLHGVARGSLGGGISAAAAAPFANMLRSQSLATRALGRSLGSGIGGAGSRAAEIGYDRTRGTYTGSLNDALRDIRGAGLQGLAQGFAEAHAETAGDRTGAAARMRSSGDRRGPPAEPRPAARPPNESEVPVRTAPDALAARDSQPTVPLRPSEVVVEPASPRSTARELPEADGSASPRTAEGAAPRPPAGDGTITVPVPHEPAAAAPVRFGSGEDAAVVRGGRTTGNDDDVVTVRTRANEDDIVTGEYPTLTKEQVDAALKERADRLATPRTIAEHIAAQDGEMRPLRGTADLNGELMFQIGSMPIGSHIKASNPHDVAAARHNYDFLRAMAPNMEAMLVFHPGSGEYMVVQGGPFSAAKPGPEWIVERHSHPRLISDDLKAQLVRSLPSATDGDFDVLRSEVNRKARESPDGQVVTRVSTIDIEVNGYHSETTFSMTRNGPDDYSLSVTFHHPEQGQTTIGPFKSIAEYEAHALQLTGVDFSTPGAETVRTIAPGDGDRPPGPPRAVRGDALTPEQRATALSVGERMARAAGAREELAGRRPRGEYDPEIAAAAHSLDAQAGARRLGLVGEPDSMIRLHAILNDAAIPPEVRAAVARAALDATRFDMVQAGTLKAGDELMMFFHGAPADQAASYDRVGVDMQRVTGGTDDDAGRGLYASQDFQSAAGYLGQGGQVFPILARRSELGNVIDVRPGSPLHANWNAFLRASLSHPQARSFGKIVPVSGRPYLADQSFFPHSSLVFGPEGAGRGVRFRAFLEALAADASLPPELRAAAADPHITLMDLGGIASWGNDRRMITDQAAIHHQRVADLLNEQMGFPKVGQAGATEAGPTTMRSVEAATDTTGAKAPDYTPPPSLRQIRENLLTQLARGRSEEAAALRVLMQWAPESIAAFADHIIGVGAGMKPPTSEGTGVAGRVQASEFGDDHRLAFSLEMGARGVPPELRPEIRAGLEALLGGDSRFVARLQEAAAATGFARRLGPEIDDAITREAARTAAERYGNRSSLPEQGQMRALLAANREAAINMLVGEGTARQRTWRYIRERIADGTPSAAAIRDGFALWRVTREPSFIATQQDIAVRLTKVGETPADIRRDVYDMVRTRPDALLTLAHASPAQFAEYYSKMVFDRMFARSGRRAPTANQLADNIASRMRSNVLPIVGETATVFSHAQATGRLADEFSEVMAPRLADGPDGEAGVAARLAERTRAMGLDVLTATAITHGDANRPGIDVIGFSTLIQSQMTPEASVRVVAFDDKSHRQRNLLGLNALDEVSAMTGLRLAENLRTSANEVSANIRAMQRGPDANSPETVRFIAGATAAIRQMRNAARAIERLPRPPAGSNKAATLEHYARPDIARRVSAILERNQIVLVVSSERGNINALASALRRQGIVLSDEYLRRLWFEGAFAP